MEVLRRSNIKIRNIAVIHANSDYVREGDINPVQITEKTDVTGAVYALADVTNEQIKKAFDVMKLRDCPNLSPRYVNQAGVKRVQWFQE